MISIYCHDLISISFYLIEYRAHVLVRSEFYNFIILSFYHDVQVWSAYIVIMSRIVLWFVWSSFSLWGIMIIKKLIILVYKDDGSYEYDEVCDRLDDYHHCFTMMIMGNDNFYHHYSIHRQLSLSFWQHDIMIINIFQGCHYRHRRRDVFQWQPGLFFINFIHQIILIDKILKFKLNTGNKTHMSCKTLAAIIFWTPWCCIVISLKIILIYIIKHISKKN